MKQIARFLFAGLLLAAAPLRADLAWTEQMDTVALVEGRAFSQNHVTTRIALKGNTVKIEDREQSGIRYYNLYNHTAVFLSLKTKSFLTVHFRDLLQQAKAQELAMRQDLDNQEAQADRLAFNVGKIQKAQVQGQRLRFAYLEQPFRLQPTKQTSTLLGHPCRKYQGYAGPAKYLEVWVAEDLKPEPAFSEYAQAMAKLDRMGFQHLLSIPGFPLKTILTFGPIQTLIEVQSLSLQLLPLDEFLLPPGAQLAIP